MAQWVVKANGQVAPQHSMHALHPAEEMSSTEWSKQQAFNALIKRRYGNSISKKSETFDPYEDYQEPARPTPEIEDAIDFNGRLLDQAPV